MSTLLFDLFLLSLINPIMADITIIVSNTTPNIDCTYILYAIHITLTKAPICLYICVSFCHTAYVYTNVANIGNKLNCFKYNNSCNGNISGHSNNIFRR